MADKGSDTQSSVSNMKETLTQVMKSLEKYKQGISQKDQQLEESQLMEIRERTSEVMQDQLDPPLQQFSYKVLDILSTFNSDISTTIDNFQYKDGKTEEKNKVFIEKVHQKCSAPISKLLYSKDFRTIYNIFVAILVNFGVAEIAKDYLDSQDFLGIRLMIDSFGKFDQAILAWIGMNIWSFITVLIIQQHSRSIYLLFSAHIITLLALAAFSVRCVVVSKLPIATSFVIICEMVRLCMKMHSYFREKLLHGLGKNEFQKFIPPGADPSDLTLPGINISNFNQEVTRYAYFLLCPSLIYRDSYPKRNRSIRWKNLSVHLFGFFGSIAYTTLIFKAFCVPEFRAASMNIKDIHALILSWFRSMLPGTMVFLLIFFAVMHSWFAIWAEILNFADRKFYDDWWNSKDFGTFYRKISVTLYEWLHTYVYLDLQRFSRGSISSNFARVVAFMFSGVVCEMILDLSIGFFMPYLFAIIALPGAFMISLNSKRSRFYNVLMWTCLIMLMGLLTLLYSLEYFYRSQYLDRRNFDKYGFLAYLIPQCFYQIYY